MVHLHSCWSPCFWHGNVRDGALATSVYTLLMSFVCVVYMVYIMAGGDTSQLWLPFFETDLDSSLQVSGAVTIVLLLLLAACSGLLFAGVMGSIRGLMLPWALMMCVVVFFQACFGL